MEDLETSWGEVVIMEAVVTLAEVSTVCILAGLNHTNAGTLHCDCYMLKGVTRSIFGINTKKIVAFLFPYCKIQLGKQLNVAAVMQKYFVILISVDHQMLASLRCSVVQSNLKGNDSYFQNYL